MGIQAPGKVPLIIAVQDRPVDCCFTGPGKVIAEPDALLCIKDTVIVAVVKLACQVVIDIFLLPVIVQDKSCVPLAWCMWCLGPVQGSMHAKQILLEGSYILSPRQGQPGLG